MALFWATVVVAQLYANDIATLFSKYNGELQNKLTELLNTNLNNWDFNTNLIQKEFVTYEDKVKKLEIDTKHMIEEYREENKRVRKKDAPPPKYFQIPFSISNEEKDPKQVFREAAFHFMNDETREKTKIEYSKSIEQMFKTSLVEVENIQKKSEELQKTLHDTYNT